MATGTVHVTVFGKTDLGRTRDHNEDTFLVADLTAGRATLHPEVKEHVLGPRGSLLMVADGMGGAAAGEIASAMATDVIYSHLSSTWGTDTELTPQRFAARLREAVEEANHRIHTYALEHPEVRGMGTTATVAGVIGDVLYLAQIGDSRGYLVRDGVATQLTRDQSLMQRLVDAGEITEEEAEQSERRNIILQALGPESEVKVDLTFQRLSPGDTIILCSDGLSGQLRRDELGPLVVRHPDLVELAARLIELANTRGGPDNITAVIARFEGEGLSHPDASHEAGYHPLEGENDREPPGLATEEVPVVQAVRSPGSSSRMMAIGLIGLILVALGFLLLSL